MVKTNFTNFIRLAINFYFSSVLKDFPYMLMPDSNKLFIKGMAIMAKLMEKLMGVEVVTNKHYVAAFMMMLSQSHCFPTEYKF